MPLLWLALAASAASSPPEPAEMLLERMLDAHGGLDRFHALSDWHVVADRRISKEGSPLRERYVEYMSRRNGAIRTLLIKERPDGTLVFGHDGVRGFALTNGVVRDTIEAEQEGYFRAHGEYYLRALPFKWADPGVTVRVMGRDDDGRLLLEARAGDGVGRDSHDVWVAAIDPVTYLLHEARLTHDGGNEIIYRYSDHRIVEGVAFGFRLEYWSAGEKTGENVVQRFEANVGVDGELFFAETHQQ